MKKLLQKILLITMLILSATVISANAQTTVTAGDMVITSKLMTFHDGIYVARGGIKAEQKDSVMTAERGIYDQAIEVVKAIDNVKVTQPDSTLTSDYLEAYINEDRIVSRGNPKLVRIMERRRKGSSEDDEGGLKKSRIILTCNEIEAFNKEDRFLAKGNVRVIEVEYRESETEEEAEENEKTPITEITCEFLEMYSKENKAILRNNVDIITETLRATGDKGIYLDNTQQMTIVGHAHAYQTSKEKGSNNTQTSELYANKILYYTQEERTIAVGNVHATVYPGSSSDKKDKDKKKKDKDKKKKKKKKADEESSETEKETKDEEFTQLDDLDGDSEDSDE